MQREHAAQAINLLLADVETRAEGRAVLDVARRSGFMWLCPTCSEDKYPNRETCCGNPRPDDPWED